MPACYTYYLVDGLCLLFPFIFSVHSKIKFYKQWPQFFVACAITAAFFIGWDVLYTHLQVWRFNPRYTGSLKLFNLPVEEVLFFFCIPYACLFSYHCLNLFLKERNHEKSARYISIMLIVFLLVIAVSNIQKIYTSVTFILLAAWLAVLLWHRATFLYKFYRLYALMLIPFLISNGVLTGSFIEEPVVIYNNYYNLSIRLFTIPVEDVFYGMLLILMTTTFYERLTLRQAKAKVVPT